MNAALHEPMRECQTIRHGRRTLDTITQLVQRQLALPGFTGAAAEPNSRNPQCAKLDGEEVDPRAKRLENDDDPDPELLRAASVNVHGHPDRERELKQVEDLQQARRILEEVPEEEVHDAPAALTRSPRPSGDAG